MKDRSAPFSNHMVRAILEGRKTTMRIPVKSAVAKQMIDQSSDWISEHAKDLCPLGVPGDRIWIREDTEAVESPCGAVILSRYVADKSPILYSCPENKDFHGTVAHWNYPRRLRPSARMQSLAKRIVLEVKSVKVERLQSISDDQCVSEGIIAAPKYNKNDTKEHQYWRNYHLSGDGTFCVRTPRESFQTLWRYNNGWSFPKGEKTEQSSPHRWDENPLVWVIEFDACVSGHPITIKAE